MSPARKGAGGSGQESATARLTRLLTMVPWLLNRQGVDISEAAAEFGVSAQQIESDLALLFVCGLPGGMPDDLIEAEWESGRVYLGNADTIARPLRLGMDEALTLIVGLRTLAQVPGIVDREAIERTLAKLEQAMGQGQAASADAASARIHVDIAAEAPPEHLAALRTALDQHRRVHLRYLVPSRDESTERDVDPMRLTNVDGRWYLEGWCHRSNGTRFFRADRIEAVQVLDVDGTPPPQARPRDLDAGLFQPRQDDLLVTLRLEPQALWVADYYPHEGVEYSSDGGAVVHLKTPDTTWLRRLLWRLGGSAHVVQPAALAREVETGAAQALQLHRSDVNEG
ncbi:helix-turn-helix transcriptional regulator [Gephyromycinifex aptenodytis]|uniref:helix-turn-helix transcriptional regulator n=1 Tax=Gephyromycinifex aptenodytis TaxID=2716227 RepID=UPI0014486955|nr:WYL domain-containing protein [Gephyromycinifex aptenodytis]